MVTKDCIAHAEGFRDPGSLDRNTSQETPFVMGPGALRECPGLRPKDARRRDPSHEPPDCYQTNSTGLVEMPIRQEVIDDNVAEFPSQNQKPHLRVVQSDAPPEPEMKPWSVDQIGKPANGMVHFEATIPLDTYDSLLRLLQHPGCVVVENPDGTLTLARV